MARTARTVLLLAAAIALVLALVLHTFARPVLGVLGAPTELSEAATPFFQVALLGVPLIVLSIVAGNVLRSLEQPRVPMVATIAAAAVNMALGYALVHGRPDFPGSAWLGRRGVPWPGRRCGWLCWAGSCTDLAASSPRRGRGWGRAAGF